MQKVQVQHDLKLFDVDHRQGEAVGLSISTKQHQRTVHNSQKATWLIVGEGTSQASMLIDERKSILVSNRDMDGVHHRLNGPPRIRKYVPKKLSVRAVKSQGVLKQLRDEANSDIVVTEAAEWEHKKTLMN